MTEELIKKAMEARKNAYAPYSHFQVGACLQGKDGEMILGCNVENSSYSATNCAERTAFFKAVSQGIREFQRIVIVGGREDAPLEMCPPCGVCLQVMTEFCEPESFEVILATSPEKYETYLLKNLLPLQFGKDLL
jgi:cytidine deaminase